MSARSFNEARKIVQAERERLWGSPGTYHVSEQGYDAGTHYVVNEGASEYLIDGDPNYLVLDDSTLFVGKKNGQVEERTFLYTMDDSDAWVPVVDLEGE